MEIIVFLKGVFTEYIAYIVPFFSVLFSYILGRLSNVESAKREVYLKRYEAVYVPYMQYLLAGFSWKTEPSDMPFDVRAKYFDIIMKNTQYLGKDSSKRIPIYYKSFLDLLEKEDGNDSFQNADKTYDVRFEDLTICLLEEAEKISKVLKYPNLARTVLEFYEV